MRAITLWQPYGSLIANGHKQFETRSWPTNYRGTLLIHAASRPIDRSGHLLLDLLENQGLMTNPCKRQFVDDLEYRRSHFPSGCIVAGCNLVDCLRMTEELIDQQTELELTVGGWEPGRFAWKLEGVERLENPIPAKGSQGLWIPAIDVVQHIYNLPVHGGYQTTIWGELQEVQP